MNAPTANRTVLEYWAAAWSASFASPEATPPLVLDNEVDAAPGTGGWVRVVTRERGAVQETIGNRRRWARRDSAMFVQVFVPIAAGAAAGLELARIARAIIEARTIDAIRVGVGSLRPADNDGKWWNITVEVPFWYRELLQY